MFDEMIVLEKTFLFKLMFSQKYFQSEKFYHLLTACNTKNVSTVNRESKRREMYGTIRQMFFICSFDMSEVVPILNCAKTSVDSVAYFQKRKHELVNCLLDKLYVRPYICGHDDGLLEATCTDEYFGRGARTVRYNMKNYKIFRRLLKSWEAPCESCDWTSRPGATENGIV